MDDAHRPRIDLHRGEAKMGMDYFFLARATDPQHSKAVLNCLDFQSGAVFSAMVLMGGGPYALAVALEAIKFTGRTRLIIMSEQENAVNYQRQQNTRDCCDQHTEGIEYQCRRNRASKLRGREQIRTQRSRFEENYGEIGPQDVAISGAALCVVDHASSGEVRWEEPI